MSIRVLSDEDYNKLCTWGMTARLPLLPGETMKNLIERMRQSNIACVKAWYGDPATDQIGPWEFDPDYSCDLLEILEIIGAYDYNIDVECEGLAIARRFLDYIGEGADAVSQSATLTPVAVAEG